MQPYLIAANLKRARFIVAKLMRFHFIIAELIRLYFKTAKLTPSYLITNKIMSPHYLTAKLTRSHKNLTLPAVDLVRPLISTLIPPLYVQINTCEPISLICPYSSSTEQRLRNRVS